MIELAVDLAVFRLFIGERGAATRAPVDDIFPFVDKVLAVELHEYPAHGARKPFVHGEPFAVPVARGAELLELARNHGVVGFLPLPDLFDEGVATQVVSRLLLSGKFTLHNVLRGDARMIGARHPERLEPRHPLVPGEDVLQRVVQRMAHVQHAGHVRRRNNYRKFGPGRGFIRMEKPVFPPEGVPAVFDK